MYSSVNVHTEKKIDKRLFPTGNRDRLYLIYRYIILNLSTYCYVTVLCMKIEYNIRMYERF